MARRWRKKYKIRNVKIGSHALTLIYVDYPTYKRGLNLGDRVEWCETPDMWSWQTTVHTGIVDKIDGTIFITR